MNLDVEAFQENGYAVLRGAVPAALCEALVGAHGEVSGLDADRPETWYGDPPLAWDIVPVWGHQAQWDIRQHPAQHRVWSMMWGTSALLVTLDRCRFTPPWRDTEKPPLSLHWAHNSHDTTLRWIQGVVALRDTPAGAGGFRCVPTLYRTPGAWMREPILEDAKPFWSPQVDGYEVVEVPAGQGDLIVWESRMPRANSRNASDRPRLACYVSMNPGTPEERRVTAECARSGACFPAWRAEPEHGHVEPWVPPRLTDLGERLAGLRDLAVATHHVGGAPTCPLMLPGHRTLYVDSQRRLERLKRAHGRHSARSRGFSKPDVRSKTPMTTSYGLRWFEAEPTDDGNAQKPAIPRRPDDGSSPWSRASGFETRKLAAILAADIVGRLTGAGKDRTLASRPRY